MTLSTIIWDTRWFFGQTGQSDYAAVNDMPMMEGVVACWGAIFIVDGDPENWTKGVLLNKGGPAA
jgi:hypothetical protein